MDYYTEIKEQLLNNEVYKQVKDYSKNKSDLDTYYNVGKLLAHAGKHYGEGIIKNYSIKLINELDKKYNERTLRRYRQFYYFVTKLKWSTMSTKLTWSHFVELLVIEDFDKINYYIKLVEQQNIDVRTLRNKIKSKEYERLPQETKNKLIKQEEINIKDIIPNPILIKNQSNIEIINEKILHQLILENITSFMKELGNGYSFIDSEYKIKIGDRYNYTM